MIATTLVLVGVIALQLSTPPSARSKQQEPADHIRDASHQPPSHPTMPVTNNQDPANKKENCTETGPFQRPYPPWWDATWATWALVIVGIFGTLAALSTLIIIRKQTEAIKASSDALVNSERAWIDGTFIWNNLLKQLSLSIKNHGKTPAHLHGYEIGFGWFAKKGEQRGPYDLRFDRSVVENLDILLGSGQEQPVHNIDVAHDLSGEAFAGNNSVLMYVKVKYWDTVTVGDCVRTPRHTEFVYVLDRLTSNIQRMPKYTKYE